jgi:hypothetical protein
VDRFRETATIAVALPADEAMSLFTARGERRWVDGWNPEFPAGEPDDEEEGTIFVTTASGLPTYWVVAARGTGRVLYARVTPELHAGTVEVCERGSDTSRTQIDVTYDLSALTPEGATELERFASGYQAEIRGWQDAIESALAP